MGVFFVPEISNDESLLHLNFLQIHVGARGKWRADVSARCPQLRLRTQSQLHVLAPFPIQLCDFGQVTELFCALLSLFIKWS